MLGETGRNFAAGMSGGIAYVYDPRRPVQEALQHGGRRAGNVGAAELGLADEPGRPRQRSVSVEDNGMGDPLRFDAERLRILVERHLLFTGSDRARALLDNWDDGAVAASSRSCRAITDVRCWT